MKKIVTIALVATLLASSCQTTTAPATTVQKNDSTQKQAPMPPPDSAAMMKAWNDFKTPGPNHQWMAKSVGTWEAELSQYMDPQAPPIKALAKEVITMSMNGLYQTASFTSTMMGQPMMGQSTMGYDNIKKMFVSTWIDNLGSGIVYMTGNYDPATKTLNLSGKQTDAGLGKESNIRQQTVFTDDNTYTMKMYGDGFDGKEILFMEGTFKRK